MVWWLMAVNNGDPLFSPKISRFIPRRNNYSIAVENSPEKTNNLLKLQKYGSA